MTYKTFSAVSFILAITLFSCKGPRQIQTAMEKVDTVSIATIRHPTIDTAELRKEIVSKVESNYINFEHFAARIKLDYSDDKGKNTNATANVRMRKDSLIWLSITGAMGIEGYRALITPDSVILMDKLNKQFSRRSVESLQQIVKLPVNFKVVQDIIVGNPVFFSGNVVSYKIDDQSVIALSLGEFFKHLITLDAKTNQLVHSKLDDVDSLRNRTCDITLADYKTVDSRSFSHIRDITVTEKNKLDIKLDFKQVEFDKPQSFPFNIPKSYSLK